MGRESYARDMQQRLRDLDVQIGSVVARLGDSPENRMKVELAGQLAMLEGRRDRLREKLDALRHEPEGLWEELRLEIDDEWDALVQDFEERVASLA